MSTHPPSTFILVGIIVGLGFGLTPIYVNVISSIIEKPPSSMLMLFILVAYIVIGILVTATIRLFGLKAIGHRHDHADCHTCHNAHTGRLTCGTNGYGDSTQFFLYDDPDHCFAKCKKQLIHPKPRPVIALISMTLVWPVLVMYFIISITICTVSYIGRMLFFWVPEGLSAIGRGLMYKL